MRKFYIICVTMLLIVLYNSWRLQADQINNADRVIAKVGEVEILYKDVYVNPKMLAGNIEMSKGNAPSEQELLNAVNNAEKQRFLSKVEYIIRANAVSSLNIVVDSKELRDMALQFAEKELKLYSKPGKTLQEAYYDAMRVREKFFSVLKKAVDAPEREQEIYDTEINNTELNKFLHLNHEAWSITLKQCIKNPATFNSKILEFDEYLKTKEIGLRPYLIKRKLDEAITSDVKVTAEDVEKSYQQQIELGLVNKDKDPVKAKNDIARDMLNGRKEKALIVWLQNEYKKVDIIDSRFSGIIPLESEAKYYGVLSQNKQ